MVLLACTDPGPLGPLGSETTVQGFIAGSSAVVIITPGTELTGDVLVEVEGAFGRVTLTERAPGACYTAINPDAGTLRCFRGTLPDPAAPGATYEIVGRIGGSSFAGITIVPVNPSWMATATTVEVDTTSAIGRPTPAATVRLIRSDTEVYWMRVGLSIDSLFRGGAGHPANCGLSQAPAVPLEAQAAVSDLVVVSMSCASPWDSAHASVRIDRYDASLSAFLAEARDGPTFRTSFGIEGVWGYWGSASSQVVPVTLVPI